MLPGLCPIRRFPVSSSVQDRGVASQRDRSWNPFSARIGRMHQDAETIGARAGAAPDTAGWAGHPRGLTTLFFTEMWERFSYYGMRAFLILYMVAPASSGGLGFSDADAASIYGTYTGSVWGAAILGGIVADRLLGQYRSVLIGGIIIALGHFTLAFHALPFFYTGLGLI